MVPDFHPGPMAADGLLPLRGFTVLLLQATDKVTRFVGRSLLLLGLLVYRDRRSCQGKVDQCGLDIGKDQVALLDPSVFFLRFPERGGVFF